MANFSIPPGGFAGNNQMTWASRLALRSANGTTSRRRKRKSKKARGRRAKKAKRASGGTRKMKFGSPAWQKKYKVGKFAKKR